MKKYYADMLFAGIAAYWLSNVNFSKLSPLQYVIFGLIGIWIVMFLTKLFKK